MRRIHLRSLLPWVAFAAALVLYVAFPRTRRDGAQDAVGPTGMTGPTRTLEQRFTGLDDALGARLDRLEARVESLERTLAAAGPTSPRVAAGSPADDSELAARVAALEERLAEPNARAADRRAVRALTNAIARGDEAEVRRLLAEGIDPNGRDDDGKTPLAAAAIAGRADLIDLLVAGGADLERKTSRRGMTPFLAALDAIQEETALGLLDRGCDPRAVDKNGENSLIWAAFNGCEKVVQRLLAEGLDVDFQAHDGGSALMDAARKGRLGIVRLLLESGADTSLVDKNGATALAMAREKGQDAVVALFAEFGVE